MINHNSKIYIAGHNGMVGSACWRLLKKKGYNNLVGFSSNQIDLRNFNDVFNLIKKENPDIIIDAAARVGGIMANSTYPYEFLMDNMLIQNNLIKSAYDLNIKKFIFLGSSCIYPKMAAQPILEEYLMTGSLEETNQWYAIAKITGVKLIEALRQQYNRDYVSLMPTNLYGPGDNYDLETSHVLPALLQKFHDAKINNKNEVVLWGSGKPLREFLHVDDLAFAVIFAIENKLSDSFYNIGSEKEITIRDLANIVKQIVNFEGKIKWDLTKPDGTMRKLIDSKKFMQTGWQPSIELIDGISKVYNDQFKRSS
jgi:GDP-L-fucose synthase